MWYPGILVTWQPGTPGNGCRFAKLEIHMNSKIQVHENPVDPHFDKAHMTDLDAGNRSVCSVSLVDDDDRATLHILYR